VQSLPSECKDKLLHLLSPSASKGCSKSKINREIVKSVDKFTNNLEEPAKRKLQSLMMDNQWAKSNHVDDNENDEDVVFSPPTRRKVENVSNVLNNKENEEGNATL
jgi:hypothetical protein